MFDGHDITRQSINGRIRAGIARSFRLVNLFDNLTVLDNNALTIFAPEDAGCELAGRAHAVRDERWRCSTSSGWRQSDARRASRRANGSSSTWLAAPRPALFLDEPTSGVSTREKAPIMDIVTAVVRAEGITAVVIEHDMDIVFRYSDRIVAMHQGAILASGSPDEIRRNEQVAMTLLGTHATQ